VHVAGMSAACQLSSKAWGCGMRNCGESGAMPNFCAIRDQGDAAVSRDPPAVAGMGFTDVLDRDVCGAHSMCNSTASDSWCAGGAGARWWCALVECRSRMRLVGSVLLEWVTSRIQGAAGQRVLAGIRRVSMKVLP
jgi:hypothetical protein